LWYYAINGSFNFWKTTYLCSWQSILLHKQRTESSINWGYCSKLAETSYFTQYYLLMVYKGNTMELLPSILCLLLLQILSGITNFLHKILGILQQCFWQFLSLSHVGGQTVM
jgi:hypothetical protein